MVELESHRVQRIVSLYGAFEAASEAECFSSEPNFAFAQRSFEATSGAKYFSYIFGQQPRDSSFFHDANTQESKFFKYSFIIEGYTLMLEDD